MDVEGFWKIIATTHTGKFPARERGLRDALERLVPEEVIDFRNTWWELLRSSYRCDLWAVAYLMGGGCSDDSFEDFRDWLIMMGRDVYVSVTQELDALAEIVLQTARRIFFQSPQTPVLLTIGTAAAAAERFARLNRWYVRANLSLRLWPRLS